MKDKKTILPWWFLPAAIIAFTFLILSTDYDECGRGIDPAVTDPDTGLTYNPRNGSEAPQWAKRLGLYKPIEYCEDREAEILREADRIVGISED